MKHYIIHQTNDNFPLHFCRILACSTAFICLFPAVYLVRASNSVLSGDYPKMKSSSFLSQMSDCRSLMGMHLKNARKKWRAKAWCDLCMSESMFVRNYSRER